MSSICLCLLLFSLLLQSVFLSQSLLSFKLECDRIICLPVNCDRTFGTYFLHHTNMRAYWTTNQKDYHTKKLRTLAYTLLYMYVLLYVCRAGHVKKKNISLWFEMSSIQQCNDKEYIFTYIKYQITYSFQSAAFQRWF